MVHHPHQWVIVVQVIVQHLLTIVQLPHHIVPQVHPTVLLRQIIRQPVPPTHQRVHHIALQVHHIVLRVRHTVLHHHRIHQQAHRIAQHRQAIHQHRLHTAPRPHHIRQRVHPTVQHLHRIAQPLQAIVHHRHHIHPIPQRHHHQHRHHIALPHHPIHQPVPPIVLRVHRIVQHHHHTAQRPHHIHQQVPRIAPHRQCIHHRMKAPVHRLLITPPLVINKRSDKSITSHCYACLYIEYDVLSFCHTIIALSIDGLLFDSSSS
jgi:hypothetical protein